MISEGKPVVWLFLYMRYLGEREDINNCPLLKPHLSLTKYGAKNTNTLLHWHLQMPEDVHMCFFKNRKYRIPADLFIIDAV